MSSLHVAEHVLCLFSKWCLAFVEILDDGAKLRTP